jgi:hypothetical protein
MVLTAFLRPFSAHLLVDQLLVGAPEVDALQKHFQFLGVDLAACLLSVPRPRESVLLPQAFLPLWKVRRYAKEPGRLGLGRMKSDLLSITSSHNVLG